MDQQFHNPNPRSKASQIDYIIQKSLLESSTVPAPNIIQPKSNQPVHLMRAVFIAIDMTQSMKLRDIKPSRLGVTIEMIKKFIKIVKDISPLCKFMVARVENQLCKPMVNFTFSENSINQILDRLKINDNSGFFSLENTLSVALDYFDSIPNTYHKEVFIIQSSPFTKDYKDIYKTIAIFQQSKICVNIASMVGWTFICKKLVDTCNGKYVTISSSKQFEQLVTQIAQNPVFSPVKVLKKLVKMALAKRQCTTENNKKLCYCHYKPVQEYFVCGMCGAILCERMPLQCTVCMTTLVFPSDLYRHRY